MSRSNFLLGAAFYLATIITFASVNAHNITEILNEYGDFSQFNQQLSQTHIAAEINRRRTITVLAVDNGGASQLSSQPMEMEKKILSLHVILDYYDVKKLKSMKKSVIVTTLFQSSGLANNQLGFLNVTRSGSDQFMFGSASPGSDLIASLVKSVYSQPFNISVLQISSIIAPAGLSNISTPATPPSPSRASGPSHAPAPSNESDSSSPPSPSPKAEEPTPESDTPASADGPAPVADSADAVSSATRFEKLEVGLGMLALFACLLGMI